MAELRDGLVNHGRQAGGVPDVDLASDDPSVQLLHQLRGDVQILTRRPGVAGRVEVGADVDGDDVGALLGQPDRMRASLTPCRPRDQSDLAVHPSHELLLPVGVESRWKSTSHQIEW